MLAFFKRKPLAINGYMAVDHIVKLAKSILKINGEGGNEVTFEQINIKKNTKTTILVTIEKLENNLIEFPLDSTAEDE